MKEVNLLHGSFKDFDKFDLKYLNSGWGNQKHLDMVCTYNI